MGFGIEEEYLVPIRKSLCPSTLPSTVAAVQGLESFLLKMLVAPFELESDDASKAEG